MKRLNEINVKKFKELGNYYKYFYNCNTCGSIYGSDNKENNKMCPNCEREFFKKKR